MCRIGWRRREERSGLSGWKKGEFGQGLPPRAQERGRRWGCGSWEGSGGAGGQDAKDLVGIPVIAFEPVREGGLTPGAAALGLVEENGQGTAQGQGAGGPSITHQAVVFPQGMVPPVVLGVLNGPVAAGEVHQGLWAGLLRQQAGDPIGGFLGGLDHPAPAEVLTFEVDAKDLPGPRQTQGGAIDRLAPQRALVDPPVGLVHGLDCRGGKLR